MTNQISSMAVIKSFLCIHIALTVIYSHSQFVAATVDLADVLDTGSIKFNDIVAEANFKSSLANCSSSMCLIESSDSPEPAQGRTFKAGKFELEKNPNDESIFLERKIYNSSVLVFTPLFVFLLPSKSDFGDGSSIDLTNQAIFALFGLFVAVSQFLVPVLLTGTRDPPGQSRSAKNLQLNVGNIFQFQDSFTQASVAGRMFGESGTSKIGFDKKSCLMNIICEAYRNPEKYRWIGAPFRAMFPLENSHQMNQYGQAAKFGFDRRTSKNCQTQYKCLFDFLDLTEYFLDMLEFAQVHPKINAFDDINFI